MAVNEQDYVGFALDPATGKRHTLQHLPEDITEWEPQVYMLEENDKVLAGIQGVVNLPIQQLTNRTAYLKSEIAKRGAVTKTITLAASGWASSADAETESSLGSYVYTYEDADIDATMIPQLIPAPQSLSAVQTSGINDIVQTLDGKLLLWADQVPSEDITAQLTLFAVTSSIAAGDVDDTSPTMDDSDIGDVISGMYPDD
ncbi:MAG: hypothetical protein IJ520_02335 [Synergistaceae bacterium]|nr:hypothetical protein [Synergistaceae bacterium]